MTATPEPAPVADPADADRRRLPVLASPQPMMENLVVRVFVAVPMLALLVALPFGWLCLAWRRSGRALLDTPAGPARDELVRIRGCLLDEIERRDHDGFARWLEAGARAGSDPTRYLTTERGE